MSAVTSVVNVHSEGSIARATIESMLDAADYAGNRGVKVQTLLIADRATPDTIEAIRPYQGRLQLKHVDVGDPSLARNSAIEFVQSEYVSFFDGDDMAGETWLFEAFCVARKNPKTIVHPHLVIHFGDRARQHICEISPIDRSSRRNSLIYANQFPSVHMCRKSTCLAMPYRKSELAKGFGYEDWTWNRDTIGAGYQHLIAKNTIILVRRKLSGSLSLDTTVRKCLAAPSPRFFEIRKQDAPLNVSRQPEQ